MGCELGLKTENLLEIDGNVVKANGGVVDDGFALGVGDKDTAGVGFYGPDGGDSGLDEAFGFFEEGLDVLGGGNDFDCQEGQGGDAGDVAGEVGGEGVDRVNADVGGEAVVEVEGEFGEGFDVGEGEELAQDAGAKVAVIEGGHVDGGGWGG